jgi:hypothetical protein
VLASVFPESLATVIRKCFAAIGTCVLFVGCNGGNGLIQLPPVTPAQAATTRVTTTGYFVELHPLDAPGLPMLRQIHDQWHASGIRIDYTPTNDTFYDALVSNARRVGLKVAFTTPYASLNSDVAAYARSAGIAAKRYAGLGMIWEIYNEPDLLYGEDVDVAVPQYVALAKPTALAIRANDATALILTGGTSGRDEHFPFAIAAGKALAPYVDAVSIHPYGIDYNSMGAAVVEVSLATGKPVDVTEWASYGGQDVGEAMTSAKGLTSMFCIYEYQEQASEFASHDVMWGLLNTGAWAAFAAAAL